jgi:hypothetical protein
LPGLVTWMVTVDGPLPDDIDAGWPVTTIDPVCVIVAGPLAGTCTADCGRVKRELAPVQVVVCPVSAQEILPPAPRDTVKVARYGHVHP